jgi:HAD superfamily phosphatase (TIGR01668 family)
VARLLDLCNPDVYVDALVSIDPGDLKAAGFEAVLLDLDNTMLPWKSSELPESTRGWVRRAKEVGLKLCIVSNTHYPRRLNKIAGELEVPSVDRALKPRKQGFMRALLLLDCAPDKTVVIGDQVMTDIIGGNAAGMLTVLVKPMHPKEFLGTKLSRVLESAILALLRARGELGTKSYPAKSQTQDTR